MYRTRSGARLPGAMLGVWMLACSSGCGALTRYIPYEDETSIIAKGTFSKANGYGGIIVWTLQEGWLLPNSSGGRSQNALMQASRTVP